MDPLFVNIFFRDIESLLIVEQIVSALDDKIFEVNFEYGNTK